MTVSEDLVAHCQRTRPSMRDPDCHDPAFERLVDALACMVLGLDSDAEAPLARVTRSLGDTTGRARILGAQGGYSPRTAAFANATLTHALDFDDTTRNAAVHPGAVVVPTALAMGESTGARLTDVLSAIAIGYACLDLLGDRINPITTKPHHARGFHTTATLGTFAASLTASSILNLTSTQTANALGIAGSSAAGLLQSVREGSMLKRFQPGNASARGIEAALLSEAGVDGPTEVFEGHYGFLKAYGADPTALDPPWDYDAAGAFDGVATKFYPACHHSHSVIDAVVDLRERHDISPDDVMAITVRQPSACHAITGEPELERKDPSSLVGAQMSVYFAVAVALLDGDFSINRLDLDSWTDPRISRLTQLTTSIPDPRLDKTFGPAMWPAIVVVEHRDGRRLEARVDKPVGFQRGADSRARLAHKWEQAISLRSTRLPAAKSLYWPDQLALDTPVAVVLDRLLGDAAPVGTSA
jgi:2-methylcitrate dehydratase PrpD